MFVIDLVANLRELYLRNYDVRTDLYMKLHTELGRLCRKSFGMGFFHFKTARQE